MLIDLRSDTVTKPSKEMLETMMSAEVGDDVFGEDPSVIALEEKGASLLGKEAGLFCPSGTMANQIAVRVLTQPQDELICDCHSHVHLYEGGGIAYNSQVSTSALVGERGKISAKQVKESIKPNDIYYPKSSLVVLENTANKGGGTYYTVQEIASISEVCKNNGLSVHLDGARLFNALTETGEDPKVVGSCFDTVSICLSKGLGAPVGSLLLGNRENIEKAKRIRKVFGGGMRQAGYLAAAGIFALENNIPKLKKDHERAKVIGTALAKCRFVEKTEPVYTNIIIFTLTEEISVEDFLAKLKAFGILALGFGGRSVRMVTHLDFDDQMMEVVKNCAEKMK